MPPNRSDKSALHHKKSSKIKRSTRRNKVATEFHRFNRLPLELRELIWLNALREQTTTTTNNAHFFKVRNVPDSGRENYIPTPERFPDGLYLTAPTCGARCLLKGCPGRSGDPWRHNNDSAYLHHSGMWMTCRESRYIIERYRKKDRFRAPNGEPAVLPVVCRARDDAAENDFESRYFEVYSRSDLFVLQLDEVSNELLDRIHIGRPYTSPRLDFLPMGNIAIEFTPRLVGNGEKVFRLAETLYGVNGLQRLYVVDYYCPERAELRVPPMGKRFRGQKSWYVQGEYGDIETDCARFVSDLAMYLDHNKKWFPPFPGFEDRWRLHIEILVCVPDGSRISMVEDLDDGDSESCCSTV